MPPGFDQVGQAVGQAGADDRIPLLLTQPRPVRGSRAAGAIGDRSEPTNRRDLTPSERALYLPAERSPAGTLPHPLAEVTIPITRAG